MIHLKCGKILSKILLLCCLSFLTINTALSNTEGIQAYQTNMHRSLEKKMRLASDINRYRNADNIWDVLRQEFMLPHYENNPLVQEQIEWFLNHQDFLMRSATRAAPYLYFILQQARKRHLPGEVVLLPIIESSYNPFAYSTAGAAGIWQMMPKTASSYGIKQNWWYDGRRDVVASTKAAQDHLSYLATFFEGNWLLAIAAYDTGEGNVLSAIKKNYRNGLSTDYWSLPLHPETREYVPRLLALAVIISRPDEYPIEFPPVQNAPYLAEVDVGSGIDLKQAASLAGLTFKQLMQLNSGHNRPTTDPSAPLKLVLPIENVQQFTENLERSPLYAQVSSQHYKVKNGDTLKTVAKQFNTSPSALRKANPLTASRFKPGTNLVIPRHSDEISKSLLESKQSDIATAETTIEESPTPRSVNNDAFEYVNTFENAQGTYKLQPGDTLYMVRNGEDMQKIANHFKTTPKTLMAVNHLKSDNIRAGDQLIIPTHLSNSTERSYTLNPGDTIYMVRKGDTVESIANKFKLPASMVRVTNLLASNTVQEGDRLVIPTHG